MIDTQILRNAGLEDMLEVLNRQHELKYDAVVPSSHLHYYEGQLAVKGGTTVINDTGVATTTAYLQPTRQFEDQLAERLDIPARYLRKLRDGDHLELLDENVDYWLARAEKNYFIRGFLSEDGGIARAILSDRYQVIDHLDALFATLDGIRDSGVHAKVTAADLTETRMRVKLEAPEITAEAPRFLERYRAPRGRYSPGEIEHGYLPNPNLIGAGLVIDNSETGGAAFRIAPQIKVLICSNGMTRVVDAMRKVHLGGRMEEGAVRWSVDTRVREIELIRSQARDAVRTFLSQPYLDRVAVQLNDLGDRMLDRPMEILEGIGKKLAYTEDERRSIVELFVESGDVRASGVVQAFTAYARDLEDPDRAAEIEDQAFEILEMAAR